MRRRLVLLILAAFVSGLVAPCTACAGDSPTDTLEKTKKFLEDTYPGYINNLHRSKVFNYLSWHYADLLTATQELSKQAETAWQRSVTDKARFDDTLAQALLAPDRAEALAPDLLDLVGSLERQGRRLELIARDFDSLDKLWPERCSDGRLAYVNAFFKPSLLYTPSRLDLKAPGYPVTVGMTVATDYSGGVQKPAFFHNEDAVIFAVGAAFAAQTLGISVAAACVVVSVKNVLIGLHEYHEQERLIGEIIGVQANAINALDAAEAKLHHDICLEAMPDALGELKVGDVIASDARIVAEKARSATEAATKARSNFKDLESRLSIMLRYVVATNLEKARNEYLKNLIEADAELERADDELRAELPRIMTTVADRRQTGSPLERAALNDVLWNDVVDGDARFAPDSAFTSFTLWNQTQGFLRAEVAR